MKRIMVTAWVVASFGSAAVAQTPPPQPAAQTGTVQPPVQKSWTDNITVKGDLRYRFEQINDDSKLNAGGDTYSRTRERIRARVGVEVKCNDNLKTTFEISTGQTDPISGNQTIGDGLNKKDFRLSLAYLDYNFFGDKPNEVHALAGKMKNPFMTQPDDLVWDADLSIEGMFLKAQAGSGLATFLATGGYSWVQERTDKDDTILLAGQAAAKLQFKPEVALTVGGSYYGYQHIKGYDVIDWEGKNNSYGNSTMDGTVSGTTTNKAWASKFTPVTYFAQLDLWIGMVGLPLSVYAQGLTNTDADAYDQGQMYGVSLGKSKNPRTWELGYSWAKLEKDATLGMFTDSDRWGGGTDGKGHKLYGKYQIVKGLQAGVAYFLDERKIADPKSTKDYDRLQVDLVATL
jgi:hypothetical protein